MKFEGVVSKDFFKTFNEAKGVAECKNHILKTKKTTSFTYLQSILLVILILLFISGITYFLNLTLLFYTMLIITIFYLIMHISFLIEMLYYSNHKSNCYTIIDEKGITNTAFYNIEMLFSWDLITGVVIKKHSITFITSTPCYFFFNIEYKKKILELLKKYHHKDLIIENK